MLSWVVGRKIVPAEQYLIKVSARYHPAGVASYSTVRVKVIDHQIFLPLVHTNS